MNYRNQLDFLIPSIDYFSKWETTKVLSTDMIFSYVHHVSCELMRLSVLGRILVYDLPHAHSNGYKMTFATLSVDHMHAYIKITELKGTLRVTFFHPLYNSYYSRHHHVVGI